ncbi:MAG: hypothetical protein WAO52_05495 [Prolixibacteraceae bacterium]
MKRLILFSMATMCLAMNLLAQKSEKKINAPKENSKVTKEYDEKGNLTRFDSVYTFSWSGDTTLNTISPDQFQNLFGDHFGFFPDSSFMGNSFFKNFDEFFTNPFNDQPDSVMMKRFGIHPDPRFFGFDNDSINMIPRQLDDFFQFFNQSDRDSTRSSSSFHKPKSMDEVMKMFQQQMKEMEEQQRKFFKN